MPHAKRLPRHTNGEPSASTDGAAAPQRPGLLLAVLCVPMFLVLLDVLAMNVAMPTLGGAFAVQPGEWARLVDSYTVPLALGLIPGGILVDRLGARRVLLGGLIVFALASVLGGAAPSWDLVLLARLGQGIAAAGMLPAGLAALTSTWTQPGPRARALGAWSGVSAVATALGPGVGGVLVALAGWRSVFWINVPLVLLAIVGTWLLLGDERRTPERGAPGARIPVAVSVLVAAMMTSGANGTLQVLTVHLQSGLGLAPGPAGAILLLATAPFALLGPASGRLVPRFGRRAVAAAGFALGGLGLGTLLFADDGGVPRLVPALLGIGIGLGLMTSAIVGETMAAWAARPGIAGGLNNAFRQLGTSGGVALGGAWAAHGTCGSILPTTGAVAGGWWLLAAAAVLAGFARDSRSSRGPERTEPRGAPREPERVPERRGRIAVARGRGGLRALVRRCRQSGLH